MHKFMENICKIGFLFVFPLFMMTACTGREDIALELEAGSDVYESGGASGTGRNEVTDVIIGNSEPTGENADLSTDGEKLNQDLTASMEAVSAKIYVHICGAVVNPGVYELEEGSRVFEGIKAAGGFAEDACEDYVNQASPLQDGERLAIPTLEEIEAAKADGTYQAMWERVEGASSTGNMQEVESAPERVNINTATENELGSISGIGQGKAAAIVQYRQENGAFTSVEDIMNVSGIKEGTYEKIKDKITVD